MWSSTSTSDMGLPYETREKVKSTVDARMTVSKDCAPCFSPSPKTLDERSYDPGNRFLLNPYEQFRIPEACELKKAYKMPLRDRHGNIQVFGDLVGATNGSPGKTIVIFIRHFYCPICKLYVKALSREMSPELLEAHSPGTRLIIVGCGEPDFITLYKQATQCPFEIYTDPSRRLQKQLGFACNPMSGRKKAFLVRDPFIDQLIELFKRWQYWWPFTSASGSISQNGGEFIWADGQLRFAHRMPNASGHLEVAELWDVLFTRTSTGKTRTARPSVISMSSSDWSRKGSSPVIAPAELAVTSPKIAELPSKK